MGPARSPESITGEASTNIGAMTGRLAKRRRAAQHVGVSTHVFDRLVARGVLPKPVPGTKTMWDLKAIDAALDAASGLAARGSDYDEWKRNRCG